MPPLRDVNGDAARLQSRFVFESTSESGLNVRLLGLAANARGKVFSGWSIITRTRSMRPSGYSTATGTDILKPAGTSLWRTFRLATYLPSAFGVAARS